MVNSGVILPQRLSLIASFPYVSGVCLGLSREAARRRLYFKPAKSDGKPNTRATSAYLPRLREFPQYLQKNNGGYRSIRVPTLPAKRRKNVLAFLRKKMRQIAVFLIVFADQNCAESPIWESPIGFKLWRAQSSTP